MKKRVMAGALTLSAVLAAQAEAGAYIEGRVGIAGSPALSSTETVGAAIGFEVVNSSGTFLGLELVGDAYNGFSASVAGINLRAGASLDDSSRIFLTLGEAWQYYYYTQTTVFPFISTTTYSGYQYDALAGVGFQKDLSPGSYVSVQYQHAFDTEINRAMVGIGFKF